MGQELLPIRLRARLVANTTQHDLAGHDPAPVLKLFSPISAATWLATELSGDCDTLFGLADLGFGCPELGNFSLCEITALRLPLGLRIERDEGFVTDVPLSRWADAARAHGSIIAAQRALTLASPDAPLPPEPSSG